MQFDTTAGNVTYVRQSIIASGGPWLVGYAAGNGDVDGGNMDLSATLPGTFTGGGPDLELSTTPPQLGGTCVMTTMDVPAAGIIALQTLGLTQIDLGIKLGLLGMPSCAAYCSLDASYTMIPAGGVATDAFPIPSQATNDARILASIPEAAPRFIHAGQVPH